MDSIKNTNLYNILIIILFMSCGKCGVELSNENTYSKGKRRSYLCKSCMNEYVKERWHRLRSEILEKMGGKCKLCGYNKYHGALHMHHIDPSKKSYEWKQLRKQSKANIEKEAKKCVLLCANCHAEVHAGILEI